MHDREIAVLDQLEQTYWWHRGRRRLLKRLIEGFVPARPPLAILDLGCGTGRNLEVLAQFGSPLGVDSSAEALEAAARLGFGRPVARCRAEHLPFADASFDLVSALDVFEHLDDDIAGLVEARRVLRPGGCLIVAVPAFRFLWSEHDEALGHRRRYVASEMHQKLNNTGYRVRKRTYAITFAFPLIMAFRLWRGVFPKVGAQRASYVLLPAPINAFFAGLLALEAELMQWINLPIGTSVLVVAQKPPA